jgi:RHS repeat-associated protein
MPGRSFSSGSYAYGFNGKESDDEVSGSGNQYDYGFRIYNPRIGKFLSVDPLTASYPWYTPYQFAGNKPIAANDLDGLEANILIFENDKNGEPILNESIYLPDMPFMGGYGPLGMGTLSIFISKRETEKFIITDYQFVYDDFQNVTTYSSKSFEQKETPWWMFAPKGGIPMFSKKGESVSYDGSGRHASGKGINIDLLMETIEMFKPGADKKAFFKEGPLKELEKVYKVLETVKDVQEVFDKGNNLKKHGEDLRNAKNNSSTQQDTFIICDFCEGNEFPISDSSKHSDVRDTLIFKPKK